MEHQTAEEIFCELMELPLGERVAALDALGVDDAAILEEVNRLLHDAAAADDYFTGTAVAVKMMPAAGSSSIEGIGDLVGPYQLVRKLGEGGFGVVWQAEQSTPLKRTVAVKVIKAGMDTTEVLARFDAEKHALSRMNHPNIARVLDAGMTDGGRPFFVMELVEGRTITRYCADESLSTHDKLKLYMDVCAAVNHAHQKGVIHRDIKPSNVLVVTEDGKAVVKVIDFGIAKAIDGQLTDHTLRTRAEQWIGTPAYMSPEQAGPGMIDLDTRSDIYALGVILYEMITGGPPFDPVTLAEAGYEEMRRIIREEEPPRPSVRITTQGNQPGGKHKPTATSSGQTMKSIASELDWIVMKAMDKARERRYDSAAALADDVGRFLADDPVLAKPPSTIYTLGKIAKRHRSLLKVVSAIAIVLVAATGYSSYQAVRASKAEKLAEERLAEAVVERNAKTKALKDSEVVSRFLADVFARPTPEADGRKITMVEALDAATIKLEQDLADQPLLKVELLNVLSDTYEKLGILQKSLDLRRESLRLLKEQGDQSMNEILETSSLLVSQLSYLGHYEDARDFGEEEFKLREKHQGATNSKTLDALENLALNTFRSGEYPKAIELQEKLCRNLSSITANDDPRLDEARETLIMFCEDSGNKDKIQRLLNDLTANAVKPRDVSTSGEPRANKQQELQKRRDVLAQNERELGKLNTRTIDARAEVSDALAAMSRYEEAIKNQNEVIMEAKEVYGEAHQKTLREIEKLMDYNIEMARWDEAKQLAREATKIRTGKLGSNHYETLNFQSHQMLAMSFVNKPLDGLKIADEIMPQIRRVMGPTSRSYYNSSCSMARCLATAGRTQEAMKLLAECCPHMPDDTYVNHMLASFLLWYGMEDDYEKTRALMFNYQKRMRHRFKSTCEILDRNMLICCLIPFKNEEQAQEIVLSLKQSEEVIASPAYHPRLEMGFAWSNAIHGVAYYRLGKYEKALECFDEALRYADANPKTEGDAKWERGMISMYRPMILNAMGKDTEAKLIFRENAKTIKLCKDPNEPHKNRTCPMASDVAVLLAHREAARVLGVEIQDPQGLPK